MCNAGCGAIVTVDGDQVVAVRGDRSHPISAGYLCPKGRALGRHHDHPGRLNEPAVRRERELRRTSWSDALDDLSAGIRSAIDAGGPRAFGMYKGTAHYLESAAAGLAPTMLHSLGSDSWYTSLTVDCPAVTLVAELVTGDPWLLPVPDLDAQLIVLLGTNPAASHGHTFNIPRPRWWLRRWAREGELWVIDPRRTESADVATVHLSPRPGTDHVLLAHLVRELLRDGADHDYLERHAHGVGALAEAVEPFTRDRAIAATQLDGDAIDALLHRIRSTGRVAMVTGTGLNFQAAANVAVWLAWMVSAVTGSLDRPGGLWFNPGFLGRRDLAPRTVSHGEAVAGPPSRPDMSGRFGELPCAAIVDEIEAGNLRALIVLGGNPLIAWPQPRRVEQALRALEVLAVVDVIANEVSDLATHVLPAAGQLERADVTTGAEVYALESFSQYTPAVLPPLQERRPTWWILAQLAHRLGVVVSGGVASDSATDETALTALYGPSAAWTQVRAAPGAVVERRRPYSWVHSALPGERLQLAPALLVDELSRVPDGPVDGLVSISRRLLRKTNSTLADGYGLRRPASAEVLINPRDAVHLGIEDGDRVAVTSRHGQLKTVARLDDRTRIGTLSTPHGFVEANAAALTSGAPDAIDPVTGMPITTALPVVIRRID
jgi:anaerobic selenocysteine-containing dehydrogenase